MQQLPVDVWVMDVPDDGDRERVDQVARAMFGDAFNWGGPLSDNPRKGFVREIDEPTAELASRVLEAVGARTLIDEDAYAEDLRFQMTLRDFAIDALRDLAGLAFSAAAESVRGTPPTTVSVGLERVDSNGQSRWVESVVLGRSSTGI